LELVTDAFDANAASFVNYLVSGARKRWALIGRSFKESEGFVNE